MAMDMNAALKITASVNGGAAIDQLKSSMDRLDAANGKLAAGFNLLKAAVPLLLLKEAAQAFGSFAISVVDSMAALDDMAEKTGASVEKLSALASVARVSGVDMESVSDAMVKLTRNLKGVDVDSRGAAEALKFMGINFIEFKKLDPADQLLRIAKEMDKFKDGTGKTALAIDLLGKSGANSLPFLKDLAQEGALNAKVTAQQAAMAEELEKNVNRLKAQFIDSAKALTISLIPAVNGFVLGVRDALEATKSIGGNKTLEDFANVAAKAFAVLIDVFVGFTKAASAVSGSFQSVYADLKLAGTFMFGGKGMNPFSEENRKILSDALDERNKVVEDANQRYKELWNFDGSAFFNAVSKRLDNPDKPAAAENKPAAGYTPRTDKEDANIKKLVLQMEMVEKYKFQQEALLETQAMEAMSIDMTSIAYKNLSEARQFDLKNAELSVGLLPQAKAELDKITESLKQQKIELNNLDYAQQRTFQYGAKTFLKGYLDEITNTANQVQQVMSNAFKGVEDALVEFTMTGKLNFKDMVDSLLRDMIRMQIQQGVMKHLTNFVSGFIGNMFGTPTVTPGAVTPITGTPSMSTLAARGMAFDGVSRFASGGIFSTSTPFKFASGGMMRNGVMGEAGPEAIMPLRRGADGKLGIAGAGGGSTSVVVNNYGDKQASVQETIDSRGKRRIEVTIGELVANEVRRPGSSAHSSVRDTFGARPALVGR